MNERDSRVADMAPGELSLLLDEIEKESAPERLLHLARQLQAALVLRRARQEGRRG